MIVHDVTKCRSCEASIIWTKTRSGKKMPVDSVPTEAGDFILNLESNSRGDFVRAIKALPLDRMNEDAFHTSHFATCPDAAGWRERSDKPVTCPACGHKFLNRKGKCTKCEEPIK